MSCPCNVGNFTPVVTHYQNNVLNLIDLTKNTRMEYFRSSLKSVLGSQPAGNPPTEAETVRISFISMSMQN